MTRTTPFFELRAALGEPGCSICALTVRALERYLAGVVYESVNDTKIRAVVRASLGFCAAHAELLRAARSALGTAIIQRDVLRAASAALARAPTQPERPWLPAIFGERSNATVLAPAQPCPACAIAAKFEAETVALLIQHYDELRPAFQASAGLCLDHMRQALRQAAPAGLRDDQLAIWGRLEAELDEFIRKYDHNFSHEPAGNERDSWSRALDLLSGSWRVAGSQRD